MHTIKELTMKLEVAASIDLLLDHIILISVTFKWLRLRVACMQ